MLMQVSIKKEIEDLFAIRQLIIDIVKRSSMLGSDYTNMYVWNKKDHPYKNLCNYIFWCEHWLERIRVTQYEQKLLPRIRTAEILKIYEEINKHILNGYSLANELRQKILENDVDISDFDSDLTQYNLEQGLLEDVNINLDFLRPKLEKMREVLKGMPEVIDKNKKIMADLKRCFMVDNVTFKELKRNLNSLVDKYGIDELNRYARVAWYDYKEFNISEILNAIFLCFFEFKVTRSVTDINDEDNIYFAESFRIKEVSFVPDQYSFYTSEDILIFKDFGYYIDFNTYKINRFNLLDILPDSKIETVERYFNNLSINELKLKGLDGLERRREKFFRMMFIEIETLHDKYLELCDLLDLLILKRFVVWDIDNIEMMLQPYKKYKLSSRSYEESILDLGQLTMDIGDIEYKTLDHNIYIPDLWENVTRGIDLSNEILEQIDLSLIDKWQIEQYKLIHLFNKLIFELRDMKVLEELIEMINDYVINRNLSSTYKVVLFLMKNDLLDESKNNEKLCNKLIETRDLALKVLDYDEFKLINRY